MKKIIISFVFLGMLFVAQSSFAQFDPQQADPPPDGSAGGGLPPTGNIITGTFPIGISLYDVNEAGNGTTASFYGFELPVGSINQTNWSLGPLFSYNDKARSAIIRTSEVGRSIYFYDSPDGSTSDDWCEVHIKKAIPSGYGYLLNTFQQTFEDEYVSVTFHLVGNYSPDSLDGKVSYIISYPPTN